MKNIISSCAGISKTLAMPLAGLTLLSTGCSRTPEMEPDTGIAATVAVESDTETDNIGCEMYIFRAPSGTAEHSLTEIVHPLEAGHRLSFQPHELEAYDYRFLFTAFPSSGTALAVHDKDGRALQHGTSWEDIRIDRLAGELSADYYCCVTDITGRDIIRDGKISGTLKRIVGQPVYEFFRNEAGAFVPCDIVSDSVSSVFDRISGVLIEYTGTVSRMLFDADGSLLPDTYDDQSQMISITLDGNQQAIMPQEENGLTTAYADARGSVLLAGPFMLPSLNSHRVRITFTYYDDTPKCGGSDGGNHTSGCYTVKSVTLKMPASASATLPILADHQTVCQAGLRADRIIDCIHGANLNLETNWD